MLAPPREVPKMVPPCGGQRAEEDVSRKAGGKAGIGLYESSRKAYSKNANTGKWWPEVEMPAANRKSIRAAAWLARGWMAAYLQLDAVNRLLGQNNGLDVGIVHAPVFRGGGRGELGLGGGSEQSSLYCT